MALKHSPGTRHTLDPRFVGALKGALDGDSIDSLPTDILESHDPRFLGRISEDLRRVADDARYRALGSRALKIPSDVFKWVETTTNKSTVVALALSTAANGYIREAAVQQIDTIPGPFSLALLANRLNDWVPNVRQAAEARLQLASAEIDPALVVGCIEYLWRFDEFGRASSIGRKIVDDLIGGDAIKATLRELVLAESGDRSVRLAQQLLRSPDLDDLLTTMATQHKHPRVRSIAAKTALEGVFSWRSKTLQKRSTNAALDRDQLALSLLRDPSADVQFHALQHLSQNMEDQTALVTLLKRYLVHPRRKLAELAQWRLSKLDIDWLDWLRREFDRKPTASLARALGRAGTLQDGQRIWDFAQESDDARLTLVLAAARLGQSNAIEVCKQMVFNDDNVLHARMASSALLDANEPISFQELSSAAQTPDLFLSRGLLAHVRRHSIVQQLSIFCRLETAGSPPDSTEFARIYRRLNRGRFAPTTIELSELRQQATSCPRVSGWMRRLQLT
jgi:hypothetical protein